VACDGAVPGGAGSALTAPGAQPARTSARGHKIHGFGHASPEILKTFPFDSLDPSSLVAEHNQALDLGAGLALAEGLVARLRG
jgi:hypothetical protein